MGKKKKFIRAYSASGRDQPTESLIWYKENSQVYSIRGKCPII